MTKLKVLPLVGFAPCNKDIAAHLREQADWIETTEVNIRNIFMVIERENGSLYRQTCGQPCDKARALGILAMSIVKSTVGDIA